MARVKGAEGTINEGAIGDLPLEAEDWAPEQTAPYRSLVESGAVEVLEDPKEDPGRTVLQIAGSMVRGDPLTSPVEQEIAAEIGDRAYAIVHTGDEDAPAEAANPELDEEGRVAPVGGRWEAGHDYTFAGVTAANKESIAAGAEEAPAASSRRAKAKSEDES